MPLPYESTMNSRTTVRLYLMAAVLWAVFTVVEIVIRNYGLTVVGLALTAFWAVLYVRRNGSKDRDHSAS